MWISSCNFPPVYFQLICPRHVSFSFLYSVSFKAKMTDRRLPSVVVPRRVDTTSRRHRYSSYLYSTIGKPKTLLRCTHDYLVWIQMQGAYSPEKGEKFVGESSPSFTFGAKAKGERQDNLPGKDAGIRKIKTKKLNTQRLKPSSMLNYAKPKAFDSILLCFWSQFLFLRKMPNPLRSLPRLT